jgi:vacuolar-type H+-ATPase subunit C/Vma6
MPAGLEAYGEELTKAGTPEELVQALPPGVLRGCLERAYAVYPDRRRSFFYEAALDQSYLEELRTCLGKLRGEDRDYTIQLVRQEIAVFNLMLAARGRFFYGIEKPVLLGLFAPGSGIDGRRFSALLAAPGVAALRALAAGLAVEAGPPEPDPSALEALAWKRYARLASRAFRGSHMGFGAVVGYLALRRLEAANLTTVSEGLRLGVPAGELYRRLLPRSGEAQ